MFDWRVRRLDERFCSDCGREGVGIWFVGCGKGGM